MDQTSEHRPAIPVPADCTTREVLGHVTSKWGALALLRLSDGPQRWSELMRALDGVSEKMLSQSLRTLVDDGFVLREQKPTMPPHVSYSLTDAGQAVTDLLAALAERVAVHTGELDTLVELAAQQAGHPQHSEP